MSDAANRLTRTVKFRVSERDHARLIRRAEAARLRVNELARQLVTGNARRNIDAPALDPSVVLLLQDIGLRLRRIRAGIGFDPGLCARIDDLCRRIENLMDHAAAGADQ